MNLECTAGKIQTQVEIPDYIQSNPNQGIFNKVLNAVARPFCYMRDSIYPINPVSKTRRFRLIPISFEIFIGKARYNQIASNSRCVLDTDTCYQEELAMVKRAFEKLIPHCHEERIGYKEFDYEIRLVRDSSVNAFCLPGGKMAIHTGIIQKLKDRGLRGEELEAAISFIIGHELTHANASHSVVSITLTLVMKIALRFFSKIFANLLISSPTKKSQEHKAQNHTQQGNVISHVERARLERERHRKVEKAAEAIESIGSFAFDGIRLWFARNNEYEADSHSIVYLQKAAISFEGSKEVMKMFMEMQGLKEGKEPSRFKKFCSLFSTHPRSDLRLKNIENTICSLSAS